MQPLLLIGAGGHAKACIDVIEQQDQFEIVGLIGKANEIGGFVLGYPILGTDADLPALLQETTNALIGIGQIKTPEPRIRIYQQLLEIGYSLPLVVSPRAYVSSHASVGPGTIVMHDAIVNADAVVGNNCIVNSRSLIEHDARIAQNCHISTGAIINGHASIGSGCFIGSGSVVRESIVIGEACVIGMGQQISQNCVAGSTLPQRRVPV